MSDVTDILSAIEQGSPRKQRSFAAYRRIESKEMRAAYLDQVCAKNSALRARVESLLEVHDADSGVWVLRIPDTESNDDALIAEEARKAIGTTRLTVSAV